MWKEFAGKWRLYAKILHWGNEGKGPKETFYLSFKSSSVSGKDSDRLTLYQVSKNEVVIQSDATGKYLRFPSVKKIFDFRKIFTPILADGEFEDAWRFKLAKDRRNAEDFLRPSIPKSVESGLRLRWVLGRDMCIQFGAIWKKPENFFDHLPAANVLNDGTQFYFELVTPELVAIRSEPSHTPLDLNGVDLTKQDLSKLDLTNADLSNANLSSAIVDGANLSGTILKGANLDGVDLTNIQYQTPPQLKGLEGHPTSFKGATISLSLLGKDWSYFNLDSTRIVGIEPAVDLRGLNACGSYLSKLALSKCTLDGANFSRATVQDIDFGESSLRNARFEGALLSKLGLSNCTLDGANFSSATVQDVEFGGSSFRNACFDGALLFNTSFSWCNLEEASFKQAQLGRVDETHRSARLQYAYLANADFSGANLYDVNMANVTMYGGETKIGGKAILDLIDLSGAYLAEISFKDISMKGAKLNNSCLVAADFTGADLSANHFTGACLQGAEFENATLKDADFTNAHISFDKGRLMVRFRDENRKLSEERPLGFRETGGLTLASMQRFRTMICPNGKTAADNLDSKASLQEMLKEKAGDQIAKWAPADSGK
jgi:uncharacterized protein YjbI with pentapeptide repeats